MYPGQEYMLFVSSCVGGEQYAVAVVFCRQISGPFCDVLGVGF